MDIKRRKKYFLALAQATPTVTSPESPDSPDSPASPASPSTLNSPSIDANSVFPPTTIDKVWGTGNSVHINTIVTLVDKGLNIATNGRINLKFMKSKNFDFGAIRGAVKIFPAIIQLINFFENFYNKCVDNPGNINQPKVELTKKQKDTIKKELIEDYVSKKAMINIVNFDKENIYVNLNKITVTEPT